MPYPSVATERFSPPLAPVHRGRAGPFPAARRLGHAPIHRHVAQLQADDLVVGVQRGGVQRLGGTHLRPFGQPPPDGAIRAPRRGDPLIPAAVHQRGHHVLEYHPAGHPAAVAAQRVSGVKLPAVSADEGAELDPGRLQQR
jgi:hypothetical protein